MILKSIEEEIGIKPGETTRDRKFSLELTNCIGACDQAPAMLVNQDVHGNLTPKKIARILKQYCHSALEENRRAETHRPKELRTY